MMSENELYGLLKNLEVQQNHLLESFQYTKRIQRTEDCPPLSFVVESAFDNKLLSQQQKLHLSTCSYCQAAIEKATAIDNNDLETPEFSAAIRAEPRTTARQVTSQILALNHPSDSEKPLPTITYSLHGQGSESGIPLSAELAKLLFSDENIDQVLLDLIVAKTTSGTWQSRIRIMPAPDLKDVTVTICFPTGFEIDFEINANSAPNVTSSLSLMAIELNEEDLPKDGNPWTGGIEIQIT